MVIIDTQLSLFDKTTGKLKQQKKREDFYNYEKFINKFKNTKLTTDECFTPDNIYNAVEEWVRNTYNLQDKNFVRPFYPGNDYKRVLYKKDDVVVDNPPFSILTKIIDFYSENQIKFFLFAPGLTLFSSSSTRLNITCICTFCNIKYTNGAKVRTSFLTNLSPSIRIQSAPDLYNAIMQSQNSYSYKGFNKYIYPDNLITAYQVGYMSEKGQNFSVPANECVFVRGLDEQKNKKIYGSGYLISDKYAQQVNRKYIITDGTYIFNLSDREKKIIQSLNK